MSVAATPVSDLPVAGQLATSSGSKTPPKRTTVAKADAVVVPEAR